MSYFEGMDMKNAEPELKVDKTDIVAVFHNEIIFRANENQRFCRLGNDAKVLTLKIVGRGLMVSESMCTCHGKMVDPDTGKYFQVIIKYSKSSDIYWIGEYAAIHLQETHTAFMKPHPGCLALYIFNNSEKHHKISTDALNLCKPNLKDGGKTPHYFATDNTSVLMVI